MYELNPRPHGNNLLLEERLARLLISLGQYVGFLLCDPNGRYLGDV
jgi:hypothetical protein